MKIGFLGAGQMARALASGFAQAGLCAPADLLGTARTPATLAEWQRRTGGGVRASNADLVADTEVVFLAVKPQLLPAVMQEIAPALTDRHLLVSVAAGVTLRTLAAGLGPTRRIVRTMPNTPCLVGAGATGVAGGAAATRADLDLTLKLFGAVGLALEVAEPLLDAVTGVSGSGPAYFFLAIEALADGGVRAGLPRAAALQLAAQTALGAGKMALDTGLHPGVLKDQVASPAGTTIAGIAALERAGLRHAFLEAVAASTARARELGTS